ncbi:MAG TPA: ABC transporter ATP-binding protein [Acidimicrobiales bacterium]|nr:ABC transporter ATP-binding protein [Acidimicrobiales bacterium]
MSLLHVRDLEVTSGPLTLVSGVDFEVDAGERVGLIGESGSGKSLTALAIMGLLGEGLSARGQVRFADKDLLAMSERQRCELRGNSIAMIFQEPMSALNPTRRIGDQVAETLRIHRHVSRREAERAAVGLLARVEFAEPERYARMYPHELSGGQRQRVMIASAISCDPDVILADEPTTALDVTVQRRVLDLLDRLVDEEGCALLLIAHDLAVVSEVCDRVVTMYGGRVVESGSVAQIIDEPRHPYTNALLATSKALSVAEAASGANLPSIPGSVPSAGHFPQGCPFRDRCERSVDACLEIPPMVTQGERALACWNPVGGSASSVQGAT